MDETTPVKRQSIFDEAPIATRPETSMMEVEEKRAIAEVQGALLIAKKFPRDPKKAMDRILMACTRPSLASHALYEYARGGTDITGPSIRLAEVIAQNWGNLLCGVIELSRRSGESDCMAYAWDLETNFRDEKRFTVKHLRDTKSGSYKVEAERDIYEVVANQGARRKRACILAVIPGDVQDEAVKQIEATLRTKVEVTAEKIQSILEKFGAYKVTKEMIEKRIQRRVESITPALMIQLGKIYNSLTDGMSEASEWFEVETKTEDGEGEDQSLKARLKKKKKFDKSPGNCPNIDPPKQEEASVCEGCKSRLGCPAWMEVDAT
jgi:hypothetical protein